MSVHSGLIRSGVNGRSIARYLALVIQTINAK
jgi:hypothetical protein